jgi:hypothetical protein
MSEIKELEEMSMLELVTRLKYFADEIQVQNTHDYDEAMEEDY